MTSALNPKTIDLGGYSVQLEAVAGDDILPGMLVARDGADEVIPHGVVGGPALPAFAVEYDLTGRGIDDAYELGDQVVFKAFAPGATVYALLAAGQNVAAGALLKSDGAGALTGAGGARNIVAMAREPVNNSGGSGAVRIRVETMTAYLAA